MPADHLAAILQAHWKLLWVFNPAERARRFAEIKADIEFELTLAAVAREMGGAA